MDRRFSSALSRARGAHRSGFHGAAWPSCGSGARPSARGRKQRRAASATLRKLKSKSRRTAVPCRRSVARPFSGRTELLGYISGFVSAEGCFGLSNARPRFSIHLRQDDKPLLGLANATGLGKVRAPPPAAAQPGGNLDRRRPRGSRRAHRSAPARRLSGRKLTQMDVWAPRWKSSTGTAPSRREVLVQARSVSRAWRVHAARADGPTPAARPRRSGRSRSTL